MKRFLLGALVALLVPAVAFSQPFPTPIAQAIALLTSGTTPFSIVGINASGYINWGTGRSATGYGIRDNAGVIEAKDSGGSWLPVLSAGGAPTSATYITQTANSSLSNEQALGTLASALLLNTTTTGVLSAYAGTSCTNQFLTALSGLGVGTCATVDLTTMVTGTLPVANGGTGAATLTGLLQGSGTSAISAITSSTVGQVLRVTGANTSGFGAVDLDDTDAITGTLAVANGGTNLASGTSGGVLYYSAAGTLASSGALTANLIVLGGGAGASPTSLSCAGTTTVLHGGTPPTCAAVNLATDTTGSIGVATGGTGLASYAIGDLIYASAATTLSKLADVTAGSYLRSGGVTTAPVWSTLTLPNAATTGDLFYASGANTGAMLADVAAGSFLRSGGVAAVPAYSTTTWPNATTTGDILISTGTNAIGSLADVAVNRVLISGGVGVAPSWSVDVPASTFTGTSATMSSYVKATETTFANRPATPAVGMMVNFSDAATTTWGANVTTGGGSNHIQARYNGAQWTVVGK